MEFRAPDPTANPYLAFAAMLMAGLDGIKRKLEPPAPIDEDLYELHDERKKIIKTVPGSLAEAVDALEADHEFLLEGEVFTPDVLETWIYDEADQGHRAGEPAAAPVRVLPVLRRVRKAARLKAAFGYALSASGRSERTCSCPVRRASIRRVPLR